jgi:hypothetical protein
MYAVYTGPDPLSALPHTHTHIQIRHVLGPSWGLDQTLQEPHGGPDQ